MKTLHHQVVKLGATLRGNVARFEACQLDMLALQQRCATAAGAGVSQLAAALAGLTTLTATADGAGGPRSEAALLARLANVVREILSGVAGIDAVNAETLAALQSLTTRIRTVFEDCRLELAALVHDTESSAREAAARDATT